MAAWWPEEEPAANPEEDSGSLPEGTEEFLTDADSEEDRGSLLEGTVEFLAVRYATITTVRSLWK